MQDHEERRPGSLFPGAKAFKEYLRGSSPHELRMKIIRLTADLRDREAEIQRLQAETRGLRASLADSVPAAEIGDLHQRAVTLEQENRCLLDVIRELRDTALPVATGDWVIGDVGDLPAALQKHFGTINEARAAAKRFAEQSAALEGFAGLWSLLDPVIKRRVLAECDRAGGTAHMAAVTYAAKYIGTKYDIQRKEKAAQPEGKIVAFAKPGDRF